MEFKEALKRIEKAKEVKNLKSSGYFLNSGIAMALPGKDVSQWIFTFYNMKENKVVQATVDETVEFKEPATPINPTQRELDAKKVKTNSDKVLKKATKEFMKFKQPAVEIIMSIQNDEQFSWHVNFVTKMLYIVTVKISAEDGKILDSKMTSLSAPPEAKPVGS